MVDQYFLENARSNWTKGNDMAIKKYNKDHPDDPYVKQVKNDKGEIVI